MRYFIYFAYNGTAYHGWQIQPNGISIQEVFTNGLRTLLQEETEVVAAGRTDTGVHAKQMVAHFDSEQPQFLFIFVQRGCLFFETASFI